jgi:hypothetical protein
MPSVPYYPNQLIELPGGRMIEAKNALPKHFEHWAPAAADLAEAWRRHVPGTGSPPPSPFLDEPMPFGGRTLELFEGG